MRKVWCVLFWVVWALPMFGQESNILSSRSTTILGPTGLFSVPTADVVSAGRYQLGTHFGRDLSTVSLNAGIAHFAEIGFAYLDRTQASDRSIVNAKAQFVPTGLENIKIGVGIIDVAKAIERTGYLMFTIRAEVPVEAEETISQVVLHVGYGTGAFRERIIGGIEGVLSSRWRVIVEYDGDNVNGGLRYSHDRSLRLQGGVWRNQLFFSAGYVIEF